MESIQYASLPDEDIVVIRVLGRGNHTNSLALREAVTRTSSDTHYPQYIFDMTQCSTLDSTFMGVMAGIAMREQAVANRQPIVLNMNDHVHELLANLGLKFIMELRPTPNPEDVEVPMNDSAYQLVQVPNAGKIDRIVFMIEAHEKLMDLSGENEIQFQGVLQSLKESLNRTRDQQG